MTSNPPAFILVQDIVGYKYDSVVMHMVKRFFGTPQSTCRVLRGELLKEYHHEEKNYNYVLQKDPSIFLRCAEEEVAPLLTQKEFMLMEGIEKPRDRFDAFCDGILDFGSSLELGSRVFVHVYNEGRVNAKLIRATVHYIGAVQGYQGFQFGVELKEKIEGGHCGTASGFSYFQCEDGYGKFVPLNRLVKYTDERYSRQSSSSSSLSSSGFSTLTMRSKGNYSLKDGPFKSTRSRSNLENQPTPSTCNIGDRVRFYSKQGQPSEGTVKWIGKSSRTRNFETFYVGILTGNDTYATDYESSLPGLSHLIDAPARRTLFIPESMVDKIEEKDSSKKNTDESVTSKHAEEMNRPKHEMLDEQQKIIEQQKELEEEFKRAGVPHEEVMHHLEQLRRHQEKKLLSKESKGRSNSRQPVGDPNHQQLQQSNSYHYYGRQVSGDHQKKLDDLHFREGHYSLSFHLSESSWRWKQENKWGLHSKVVSDLESEIKRLMFSSNNSPVSVMVDQSKFTEVMAAFHKYERSAKRDFDHSYLIEVIKKFQTHMDALFLVDLPFYIFIVYRMHKKYGSCSEMRILIANVINKVESEDKHKLARTLNAFCERSDFSIMFNPDKSYGYEVSILLFLEVACLELAELSYKIQIISMANARKLSNGFKPVYRRFVYSRMFWISMAMKLHEKRVGQPTRNMAEVWEMKLVSHHQRVDLSSGFIKELEAGLEVGQLLQLSAPYTFHGKNLIDFLATHEDRTLRPLAQIMECFKMLKRFVRTLDEAMMIVSSLRAVYNDYLVKPVPPYKMTSISYEGTLNGCIVEGIELLFVMLEWLIELNGDKKMIVIDQELKRWLRLLLSQGGITDNTALNFLRFIKVLDFEGDTSSSSEAAITKSIYIRVCHLEAIVNEKENTISKLIGEAKHHREDMAKMKQSYEARLRKKEEILQNKEEMLQKTEEMLQEKEEMLQETEEMLQVTEEMWLEKDKILQKTEEMLQEKEEMLQKNEEILQNKGEEIADHLQVIASKEKEGNDLQSTIEKLNEKLEAYDKMYDESWIQISQDSVPSWKIDRSVLKCIPQTYMGNGAWGVVYSAEFKGEQVAIKHAYRELLRVQGTVAMVKREISILAHIHHPNLVRFIGAVLDHDVESKRDVPIIVLELLDMNLRTAYENENLSQAMMVSIFCDVAYALHYLHEQTTPIIHRDVSAPNILLKKLPNNFYRAKVSDFGSANLARLSTTAGAGAIIYTAPEMFPQEDVMAEPPEQTVKVDVFSFGIVMLEVVCREMPVPEKRRALLLHCESRWKVIYDLVRQCTRVSPNDRPTMREILQHICGI